MKNDYQDILRDIERDEQWLRDNAPPTPKPTSTEQAKIGMRVEAEAQWLRSHHTPPVSPETVARTKQAIRAELRSARTAEAGTRREYGRAPRILRIAAPLAAAAAIAVVALVAQNGQTTDKPLSKGTQTTEPPEELTLDDFVAALEEERQTETHQLARELRDDLQWAIGVEPADSIDEAYDELLTEDGTDWPA